MKGIGARLMERIVPGLLRSSGMIPPDDLLLWCSLPGKDEKERPGGSKPTTPGSWLNLFLFWISKMVKAREDRNSPVQVG